MALRLGALHDALVNAGADPALAQQAAEEVAAYDRHLRSDVVILMWMIGTNIAITLAIFWRIFS